MLRSVLLFDNGKELRLTLPTYTLFRGYVDIAEHSRSDLTAKREGTPVISMPPPSKRFYFTGLIRGNAYEFVEDSRKMFLYL